jgi:molybdenum ABC transporter molybdate-binding protein
MQRTYWLLIGSLVGAVALLWLLARGESRGIAGTQGASVGSADANGAGSGGAGSKPLLLYCAASNRAAIEAIREDYRRETGREVSVQYGASQTLLSSMEVSGTGDLFLPADASFIVMAKEKGLVDEVLPLATMRGVIAVKRGNPKGIKTLEDLLADDLKLVQANPDAAAIGKVTRERLKGLGLWERLDGATDAYRTTVNEAANDVVVGAADAAIVYDAVLAMYPMLQGVTISELEGAISEVSLGVLRSGERPTAALHFARYVAARDRGLKRYAENGFAVLRGDVWGDVPELSIFAGSMLRPAIDDTIAAFEQREGVRVSRVYNGCGILVAQMKAGQRPDAYFACDREFMNSVPELFPEPVDVSQNELVILVRKGNPLGIRTLKDLAKAGVRLGIGHEKQCAMGWITQNTLRESGVQQEVMANVTVQTPTGDMLVNQLRAGGLDAAVAYLSNAAGAAETLDAIRIEGIPCSIAVQPFAVGVDSQYPRLTQRLFARLRSADSKETFLAEGFRWYADSDAARGDER